MTAESDELDRRMAELTEAYAGISTTEDAVYFEWMVHQLDHFLSGTEPCPSVHPDDCDCWCRCAKEKAGRA